jgi:hypothetical protein
VAGQIVDTPTAQEFMQEISKQVSEDELASIAAGLEAKAQGFHDLLGHGQAASLDREGLRRVLRSVFSTRRKADAIIDLVGERELIDGISYLLDSTDDLPGRLDRIDALLLDFPEAAFDLPGELLHFTYPDRFWLWSRWMWDPRIETGSLRLVIEEEFDLQGETRGEVYFKVGEAIAFVNETGKAAGFTSIGRGLLGIDIFLACVYSVYMYTVLRLRMTQEFNKIVPPLPELVARLLGIHKMEV